MAAHVQPLPSRCRTHTENPLNTYLQSGAVQLGSGQRQRREELVDHHNFCHLRYKVLNLTCSWHFTRQCYTDRHATFELPSCSSQPPCWQPRSCVPSTTLPAVWLTGAELDSRGWRIGRGVAGMKREDPQILGVFPKTSAMLGFAEISLFCSPVSPSLEEVIPLFFNFCSH